MVHTETVQLGLYDFAAIEARWQEHWESNETFRALNPGDPGFDSEKPKYYILDMFPYPSGAGLHVGHPEGYTATDIIARYKRMRGFNVLHPMGWDAFGLPAEQYAVQTGVHPSITTKNAIETFRGQLKRFGFSYDWSREFGTIDPDYYCWTQWIFLKLYHAWYDTTEDRARPISELIDELEGGDLRIGPSGELVHIGLAAKLEALGDDPPGLRHFHELPAEDQRSFIDDQRLAYISEQTVNWCPKLGTVLANEEVIDGKSERGGYPVFRKPLRQWMFRITAFAERLLGGLKDVEWPESTMTQQADWIGRSEGADIDFPLDIDVDDPEIDADLPPALRVFTTRPDTVFGATYMVVAPEHPLVDAVIQNPRTETDAVALNAYSESARNRTEVERQENKEKSGVFTGIYCKNPLNDERIPVWTADYVLMGYGFGAIMAVPGQDQRDWDFAKVYGLPIVRTVRPPDDFEGEAFVEEGPAINSGFLDGLMIDDAKARIIEWLEANQVGRRRVNFKIRDWLFSRQRYWGEPFPVVFDEFGNHHPVAETNLPVVLPKLEDFKPSLSEDPKPLLAKATDWISTTAGEAGVESLEPASPVTREVNTMPNWAGSCWYYLRYCSPKCADRFVDQQAEAYWMSGGVDLYIGGREHAVLHLLYARFWHMALYDLGDLSTPEPFGRLIHQGLITSFAYKDSTGRTVPVDEVEERGDAHFLKATGEPVVQIVAKMSKTLKNVVNPDSIIADYGADTFRLYEMYMGPLESSKPWNTRDVPGLMRLLQRIWRLVVDEQTGELSSALIDKGPDPDVNRLIHKTIKEVTEDIEQCKFNTAIAAMFEFVNVMTPLSKRPRTVIERFVLLLGPFAPHIAEELWCKLGHDESIAFAPWPEFDPEIAKEDEVEIAVQILGKVKSRITVSADADDKTLEAVALADERIQQELIGKTVRKVIVVQGRLVNIVAN